MSVNPSLTRTQVTDIIESTARKLPDYVFSTYQTRPNGAWNSEVGYGLIDPVAALRLAKGYYNLIEFDYSGQSISFTVNADKDIAVIWDWDTEDITELSVTSPVEHTFSHTFSTSGTRRIYIAEKVNYSTSAVPTSSSAITGFDFTTGVYASNIDIKPINTALEYVRIIGGSSIASQDILIKNMPALKDLYLVQMPNVDVAVDNCPCLERFGSSKYIWGAPSLAIVPVGPLVDIPDEHLEPDVVGVPIPPAWPDIPESARSFRMLNITNCENLLEVSLENVNIGQFDFSDFPRLRYLYVSSHESRIVGGCDNSLLNVTKGQYLYKTIMTLPEGLPYFIGKILVRGVSIDDSEYVPANVSDYYQDKIDSLATAKNWNLVWDPEIAS